ncbi:hypothetical protein, partial [Streptomyces sp. NPDC054952]
MQHPDQLRETLLQGRGGQLNDDGELAVQGLGRSAAPVDAVDEVADRGGEGGGRLLRDEMPDVRDR